MKPLTAFARALAMLLIFSHSSLLAQSDSTFLDLGRIRLHKDLTQTIKIQGKDLEKIPFTNLHEAIQVWFLGAFSAEANLTYIVDGVLAMDVNALSIHDIQEITLVLNAATQLSGSGKQQHLVLITTRQNGLSDKGVYLSGQSARVVTDYSSLTSQQNPQSAANYYHQYTLAGHRNYQKLKVRASANYLRDVYPSRSGRILQSETMYYTTTGLVLNKLDDNTIALSTKTPKHLDRLRLRASLELPVSASHRLYVNAAYAGQFSGFEQSRQNPNDPQHYHYMSDYSQESINLYTTYLKLQSRFSDRLHNQFNAAYIYNDGIQKRQHYIGWQESNTDFLSKNDTLDYHNRNLLLQNHLTYSGKMGAWGIEPSLNVSARFIKIQEEWHVLQIEDRDGRKTPSGGKIEQKTQGEIYLITPSMRIFLKDIFSAQAGIVLNASDASLEIPRRSYPYLSMSSDLFRLFNTSTSGSWKIFGSYARTGTFLEYTSALPDLAPNVGFPFNNNTMVIRSPLRADLEKLYTFTVGSSLSLAQDRFTLKYHYDQRYWPGYFLGPSPGFGGLNTIHEQNTTSSTHLISLAAKNPAGEGHAVQLHSQLNIAFIRNSFESGSLLQPMEVWGKQHEESSPWSLGWANRLSYKRFSMGLDLLAYFNQNISRIYPLERNKDYTDYHYHSLTLQNAYVSYTLMNGRPGKSAEVFVNSRNLSLNGKPLLHEARQYVGLGFILNF